MKKSELYEILRFKKQEELAEKLDFLKSMYFANKLSQQQVAEYHAIIDEESLEDFKLDKAFQFEFEKYKQRKNSYTFYYSSKQNRVTDGKKAPRILNPEGGIYQNYRFDNSNSEGTNSITPQKVNGWKSDKRNRIKSCKQYHFEEDVLFDFKPDNDNYSEEPCPCCGKYYPIFPIQQSGSVCGNGSDASSRDDENDYESIQGSYTDDNWL